MNDASTIQGLLADATGGLKIASIKVNNVLMQGIEASGSEDVVNLQQLIHTTLNLTRRKRARKDDHRDPMTLPIGSRARKLSVEIHDYVEIRKLRGLADATMEKTERALTLLLAACGDIYVSSITEAHIVRLWELIRWTPDGRASAKILKVRCADELITEGKALNLHRPSDATFELYRRLLRTFFRILVKASKLGSSPMEAFDTMRKDLTEDPMEVERLFSDTELQTIFDPTAFKKWASRWPHRWWCPIIGLYTGMRIGEVAQLKLADVIQENGVWCFDIRITIDESRRDSAGRKSNQRLKGASAVRRLPIPKPVLDVGFLEYVTDVRKANRLRLFPNLTAGTKRNGETKANYGACFSLQFSGYMKSLGFAKGVRFHAFRHTLITDLKHQEFDDCEIAILTGHTLTATQVATIKRFYNHPGSPKRIPKVPVIRQRQMEVLATFSPPVELPRYEPGQFWECLTHDGLVQP